MLILPCSFLSFRMYVYVYKQVECKYDCWLPHQQGDHREVKTGGEEEGMESPRKGIIKGGGKWIGEKCEWRLKKIKANCA